MTLIQNPDTFPKNDAHILIKGEAGQLELLTTSPDDQSTQNPSVAIICHPHPLHQGTMNNKVVYTLSKAFHNKGLYTVRFNYRGVGKSEGTYGDSIGEVADLLSVLKWVDAVLDKPSIYLAGFSFGAFIAARGAALHDCKQLYSIAPAVTNQPYETLSTVDCPWIVVQGENDEVIGPQKVYEWFERAHKPNMQLIRFAQTSHFFHGKLVELRDTVEQYFVGS